MHCTRCGADVEAQFRFCPQCGLRVDEQREAKPLVGERKLVTVMFCDLTGSTAIAESMDPEEYSDLLERYIHRAFGEVYRFDGYVNQLAGDGFMALFGAPVAHEDAPERGVRAALAVQRAIADLAARQTPVRARIGIHTGPVVVGNVGTDRRMDYTAIGDTTNLAARLEQAAQPGTILMSEATERLVRGRFQVAPTVSLTVKGKTDPITAFEVLGAGGDSGRIELAAVRGLTPFIGRAREMAELEQCFTRARSAECRVVSVVGDAGSGKSRLLYEFRRRLETEEDVMFFEGRGASLSQTTPLAAFITMFRRHYGIQPDDDLARAVARVEARIAQHEPEDAKPTPETPQMRELLVSFMLDPTAGPPASLSADDLKRTVFDIVEHVMRNHASYVPVVVILEDLQWIDELSRELLEHLIHQLNGTRVMFVITERLRDEPLWRPHAPVVPVLLHRLANDDVLAVVRAAADAVLPADLEAGLVRRAAGSPFFAEELVRGLLESGALHAQDGVATLARPLGEIPIPDTVQEVIAARLDRLPTAVKRVAQVAAVIGRQFGASRLAQILDGEDIDLGAALVELERRGLVHRKGALEGDTLRFGESLTQEIAYESLLFKQRRLLHERVATTLESGGADAKQSALLAYHYSRSDNRLKALETTLQAAAAAERVPSYDVAARLFQQAYALGEEEMTLNPQPAIERGLYTAVGALCRYLAMFGLGDMAGGERLAQRGLELAARLNDTNGASTLVYFRSVIIMMQGREHFDRGLAQAEDAFVQAQRGTDLPTTLNIARGLCFNYIADGRIELAKRTADWILHEVERNATPGQESDFHVAVQWLKSVVLYAADELEAARTLARATYEMAVRRDNRTVRGVCASTLAQINLLHGSWAEAQRWADEGLALAERMGNVAALLASTSVALVARQAQGVAVDAPRYLDHLERGLTGGTGTSQINFRFVAAAFLGLGGDLTRAETAMRSMYGHVGGRFRQAIGSLSLAMVLHARDGAGSAEAARLYHEALARAEALGTRSLAAEAMVGLVHVHRHAGDHEAAARTAAQAAAIIHDLGLGYLTERLAIVSDAAASAQPSA